MKITPITQQPTPPPVTGYLLELTPSEMHDLQVIANIPEGAMRDALQVSLVDGNNINTNNVYRLLKNLRATL